MVTYLALAEIIERAKLAHEKNAEKLDPLPKVHDKFSNMAKTAEVILESILIDGEIACFCHADVTSEIMKETGKSQSTANDYVQATLHYLRGSYNLKNRKGAWYITEK